MPQTGRLKLEHTFRQPNVTDQVFEAMHTQILSFDLIPGTKVSEVEVARLFGVSRQPVRDAFFRLSHLGFLEIRPQRATVITPISETAVLRARFVRAALELACLKAIRGQISEPDLQDLDTLLDNQASAVEMDDRQRFHGLDDAFHRALCDIAGQGHVWSLIREQKAHMDRVRFLSIASSARTALDDHVRIVEALKAGETEAAEAVLSTHLNRITSALPRIREENPDYFVD